MAATAATVTNQTNTLKRLYGNTAADPAYKRSKFLADMKKDTTFGGEGRYVNVTVGPSGSGSATFADALEDQDATTEVRFWVTHRKEYHIISIQGDVIARSKGDKNAIFEVVKHQTAKARYSFGRAMAQRAWGHAGGSRGRIASTTTLASTSIDLETPAHVVGFEVGMRLQFASDDGSAASPAGLRANTKLEVTAVNRAYGATTDHVTVSANLNTVASIAVTDDIFRAGDYAVAMTGMQGWCPISDPSASESFFGVDRTATDVSRLSGVRVSGSGGSREQTLINASTAAAMNGFEPTDVYCNPLDFGDLVKEVGSKRMITVEKTPTINYRALELDLTTGSTLIKSEVDVPKGYFWMATPSNITLRTAGDCPRMINHAGGGMFQQSATDDAIQGRLGAYGNIFHDNPGETVIGTW